MKITKDIKYVGVNDREIDLFEGQYSVPNGMAYNSYAIIDEMCAIMDSVDARFCEEWFENIDRALDGRSPDYLVIQHMEPDHSGSIDAFMRRYESCAIVSSAKAFAMMHGFFGTDYKDRQVVVGEGSELSLGAHTLAFVTAPMVHWPEVIMTYDKLDRVMFSADGFGKFGALDTDEEWACEARRYYFGIVGKYGAQVQAVLKKLATLDVNIICPLHGPVLAENLGYYINLYDVWSSYRAESKGVMIAYASIYGHTREAAELLAKELEALGAPKVVLTDLARCDMHEAVEDAFRYDTLVLASATYNADIFPYMKSFIEHLTERNYQNRTVAFIENGSWAPMATKVMKSYFEKSKNITYAQNEVKITSALSDTSREQLRALALELCPTGANS